MLQQFKIKIRVIGYLLSTVILILGTLWILEGTLFQHFIYALAASSICALASLVGVSRRMHILVHRQMTASNLEKGGLKLKYDFRHYEKFILAAAISIVALGIIAGLFFHAMQEYLSVFALVATAICWTYLGGEALKLNFLNKISPEILINSLTVAAIEAKLQKPIFAFHFAGPDQLTPMHLAMWLPYLQALDRPFVIIVREHKHLSSVSGLTEAPVFFCKGLDQIAKVLGEEIKVIFYANNGAKNIEVIDRFKDITHVQLLHGDSDKPPSFNPVSKIYDKLFVAGEMAVDRYKNNDVFIPTEKFEIVGRPQVAAIIPRASEREDGKTVVAYMPTWAGYHEDSKFSSLPEAASIIEELLSSDQSLHVLFKPHPLSYKDKLSTTYLDAVSEVVMKPRSTGNTAEILSIQFDAFDIYNQSHVLISDISSVIIDFLYSGKPYIVTNPQNWTEEDLKKYPSSLGGYILNTKGTDAAKLVAQATGSDPLHEKRDQVRHYAFGDMDRPPGEAFREACLKLIDA